MIAAVYLDGGWEAARDFVLREIGADIADAVAGVGGHDYKSLLQELAGRRGLGAPRYEIAEDDHPDGDTSGEHLGVVGTGLVDVVSRRGRARGAPQALAAGS